MGLFSATESGELDVPELPRDIAARIERRVAEGRLFGVGTRRRFSVRVERASAEAGYRGAAIARDVVTLATGGATEIRLAIDGTRVRYQIAVPQMRRMGLLMSLVTGAVLAIPAAFILPLDPVFASAMIVFGVAMSVLGLVVVLKQVKAAFRVAIEKMLREEALDASNAERLRADLGSEALRAKARAILAVLDARRVSVSDADRARILDVGDEATAAEWLARASNATEIGDVFTRARVEAASLAGVEREADDEAVAEIRATTKS